MNLHERREIRELSAPGNAADVARSPSIKLDGRFYAGMAALGLSGISMPVIASIVPLLGLPTLQATILFGVLAGIPDVLCIVAIGLLGKEIFQFFIHRVKNALRAVVDRRFRAGSTMHTIFDKCFLLFSVVERHLDRLHLFSLKCASAGCGLMGTR